MASWVAENVSDVISRILENRVILPVIQRRLVWDEEKMELLFDTLLRRDSFGGIMAIQEEKGKTPMFAYRYFTIDGTDVASTNDSSPWGAEHQFIIDGQQRLQTFYIGLCGTINGKRLYFNLARDSKVLEFDFRFSSDVGALPKESVANDEAETTANVWYPVPNLYQRLSDTNDEEQVADEVIADLGLTDELQKARLTRNIDLFHKAIFSDKAIGLSKVSVNRTLDLALNRQRIVELFRRLNDGGTKLSSFDLIASVLKGHSWEMEAFLDKLLAKFATLSFGQDELIKLLFILQDRSSKDIAQIEASDAQFAVDNFERIEAALDAVESFLHAAKLYNFYHAGGQSLIPIYCLAYHFFYKSNDPAKIRNANDKFDVKNSDFIAAYRWIVFSVLCGAFRSKGNGWIAYSTGLRKLTIALRDYKGQNFPCERLFKIYRSHPLHFFTDQISAYDLHNFDRQFLFYLIYDGARVVRTQDVDHIHPRNLLASIGISQEKIDQIANLQLLDVGTNRGEKNGKEFGTWLMHHVQEKQGYLTRHLIPNDESMWQSAHFEEFAKSRQELILTKLRSSLAM